MVYCSLCLLRIVLCFLIQLDISLRTNFVAEFVSAVQHISGLDNAIADCFFRAPVSSVVLGVDYDALA